ncbi:uncharacterized protein METZ01_LOCUS104773, partial [marine metagenome]|tara:strand:- start:271 stop:474 length:204 start_codon:yes stop_codon:yes gene_type:complete
VDRLEAELEADFAVIRIDVASELGSYVRQKYDGGLVPLFLIIDRKGALVFRHSGTVPRQEDIISLGL